MPVDPITFGAAAQYVSGAWSLLSGSGGAARRPTQSQADVLTQAGYTRQRGRVEFWILGSERLTPAQARRRADELLRANVPPAAPPPSAPPPPRTPPTGGKNPPPTSAPPRTPPRSPPRGGKNSPLPPTRQPAPPPIPPPVVVPPSVAFAPSPGFPGYTRPPAYDYTVTETARRAIERRALPRILGTVLGRAVGVLGWILFPSEIGKERPVEVWEIPQRPKGPPRRPRVVEQPEFPFELPPYSPPDVYFPAPRVPYEPWDVPWDVPDITKAPWRSPGARPDVRTWPRPGTEPQPQRDPWPAERPLPYPALPQPGTSPRPGTRPAPRTPAPTPRDWPLIPLFPWLNPPGHRPGTRPRVPGQPSSPPRPYVPPSPAVPPPSAYPSPLTPPQADPVPYLPKIPDKADNCQCDKPRKRRKKDECRNPVVSTRTERKAGRKYVITKRWIKCQA